MKTNFENAIRATFAASAFAISVLIVGSALSDERDLAIAFAASPGNDVTTQAVRFADANTQASAIQRVDAPAISGSHEAGTGRAASILLSKAQ